MEAEAPSLVEQFEGCQVAAAVGAPERNTAQVRGADLIVDRKDGALGVGVSVTVAVAGAVPVAVAGLVDGGRGVLVAVATAVALAVDVAVAAVPGARDQPAADQAL
ncbi:MAG: hypothetical protein AB7V27_09915 [Candidatus Binatia bacterium]